MTQQKKNITLLISLATLGLLSLILFWSSNETADEIDPTLFRLSDPKAVNKVVFNRNTASIELEFINNSWRVNKTFDADRNLVDVLFATVAQAIPKRAVASRLRDSVARETRQQGVKVDFYIGSNVNRTFWVWGNEADGLTYFIDNEGDTPYMMTIPGYRVFVAGIFTQTASTWRDKRIFNFNWRNFTELKADFPNDPNQSFRVAMSERFFSIDGLPNVDTTALNNYLDAVSLIQADAFYEFGQVVSYDSLINTKPIMRIAVSELNGQQHVLEIFTITKDERNALARWGSDYAWFDRRNIIQLYKKRKDFVKRAEP